ncbi:thiamine pyrophosphate-binding protein [Desulfospira joergensenii]|uniref:thiamine pyrophosphate-binding protein n=1 Tax=Desulfospira joergensenii TaxID=53329 RepID=UPI0003B495A5|nr:thiamine pyrophosphate-binding protein [Desulfospira joergensenii]
MFDSEDKGKTPLIGAQVIVEMLRQYQVEVIFGVPGDTSIKLYEALYDLKAKNQPPGIRHVMARDERSASFMADAYARLSHRPGICECPSGAGSLYTVPGVAEANGSSIPVIAITSDIPLAGEGKQTITELDTQKLFESITKWSTVVKDVDKVPEIIRRAFRIATTGRPGAVHIAFPEEALTREFQAGPDRIYAEEECTSYPAFRTRGARSQLEEMAGFLVNAQKPLIIVGGGANHSGAGSEIQALCEWMAAPMVSTISGQGILPDDHPFALGVIGDNGFHPHAHRAVEEADVLLYVGCKMGSVSTINWSMPSRPKEQKILQIDLNPEMLGNNFENHLSLAGDARLVVRDLVSLIKDSISQKQASDWVTALNLQRKRFWEEAEAGFCAHQVPLKPERIISALNRHLTRNCVVISDAGTPTPYVTRFLRLKGESSRFIIPRAYGGLGYAIPAVVGAHFARPDARLVGLFGDGSLGMSAGELETVSRLKIPAVLIHFNNAAFGWIKALQKLHCKEKYFSVDFQANDPVMVARGFGLRAMAVKTPDELDQTLEEAFQGKGPVFLDVASQPEVDEIPPVYSWLKTSDPDIS